MLATLAYCVLLVLAMTGIGLIIREAYDAVAGPSAFTQLAPAEQQSTEEWVAQVARNPRGC